MEHSIFMVKSVLPSDEDLREALGSSYKLWMEFSHQGQKEGHYLLLAQAGNVPGGIGFWK